MIILMLVSYFFGSSVNMPIPLWSVFLATLGIYWYFKSLARKRKIEKKGLKEIQGPKGLPLLGSMLDLGTVPHKQFNKWSDKYGSIYQVKLGNIPNNIVISDPKMCKEIFSQDPLLTGRLTLPAFSIYEEHPGLGLFNSEGERWEVHRRFLLRQLRDFGFGKSSMEGLIMEEVEEVVNRYKKQAGKPITGIREMLRLALVNSLWKILSNNRFDHDDPELMKLALNTSKAFNEVFEKNAVLVFMPWMRHIFPEWTCYNVVRKILGENKSLFERTIKDHKTNLDTNDLKDFIDVYLAEVKKSEPGSVFHGDEGERQLVAMLFDMFFAGSDSTSMTLGWSILYLCKYPRIQKLFQEEISKITGDSRRVSVNDRPSMPYTLSLIDEILRFSSIVPNGVQHKALADTEFHGYFIPKDSLISPNLFHIHHSKKIWGEDADEFKPERFLSPDGKKYIKNENLQPFQIGRRQCVGESLARDTIFLYLTSFFQTFDMKFDPKLPEPSFEAEIGFLLAPLPFTVIMTERATI